jgi:3-mercaptopyruvate sulfurtransferase SseA
MQRANIERTTNPGWQRSVTLTFAALLACLWLSGCTTSTSEKDLVMVDPDAAVKALQERGGVMGIGKTRGAWVDPRTIEAYRKGHIAGAVHLPFSKVADDHASVLAGVTVIVVYGDDYNDAKAKAMSKRLIELGYADVRTLNGGLRQWESQGNALETGDPPSKSASR